jgi:hypothetical protein
MVVRVFLKEPWPTEQAQGRARPELFMETSFCVRSSEDSVPETGSWHLKYHFFQNILY